MTEATYDGEFAPTPWRAFSQFREDRGRVVHWVEDALGGVVVADCSLKDAQLIAGAVNAYGPLRDALQAIATVEPDKPVVLVVEGVEKALALATLPAPIELASPLGQAPGKATVATMSAADIERLGEKALALAAAAGWDGSWSRHVTKATEKPPGPMSRETWADFTKRAMLLP